MGSCRSCINAGSAEIMVSIESELNDKANKLKPNEKVSNNVTSEPGGKTNTFLQEDDLKNEQNEDDSVNNKENYSLEGKNGIILLSSVSLEISSMGNDEYVKVKGSNSEFKYLFNSPSMEDRKDKDINEKVENAEKDYDFNSSLSEYMKKREEFYEYTSKSSLKQADFEKNTLYIDECKESFKNSIPNNSLPEKSLHNSINSRISRSAHRKNTLLRMRTSKSEAQVKGILKRSRTTNTNKSSKRVRFDIHGNRYSTNNIFFPVSYFTFDFFGISLLFFLFSNLRSWEAANLKGFSWGKPWRAICSRTSGMIKKKTFISLEYSTFL